MKTIEKRKELFKTIGLMSYILKDKEINELYKNNYNIKKDKLFVKYMK